MAELVASLAGLRSEFNAVAPERDKGSDGWISDSNHSPSSDHTPDEDSNVLRDHDADSKNEVHAVDIDSTGPWPAGVSFKSLVMKVIEGEKAKWLDPDDMCRLNYVIFDRKIYDKDDDFEPRDYAGSDPHTGHAHFSARYETAAENDTRPWGVREMGEDMAEVRLPEKGDTGQGVREWQFRLNDLGYSCGTDGTYDDKMEKAVNAYRAAYGEGPDSKISGWTAWHMRRTEARKYAGQDGAPGAPGAPGEDGVLTGTFTITGGTLTAVDQGKGAA